MIRPLLAAIALVLATAAHAFDHSHAAWDALVKNPRHDHAHRVIEVRLLHFLVDIHPPDQAYFHTYTP